MEEKKIYGLSNDYVFKKIMRKQELCKKFLNDIFDIQIEQFEYIDKEFVKEQKNKTYGICDIVIKNKKEIIIIEMQNKNNYNIENRSMMYLSKMYTKQWKNKDYKKLKPVTICLILNYPYQEKEIEEYQMLELKLHKKFGNQLKVKIWNTVIESKKEIIKKYKKLLSPKTTKEIEKEKELEEFVREIIEYNMQEEEYERMKEVEIMNFTLEDEILLCQATAYQNGLEEGEKSGKIDTLKETVKNMLAENFSIEMIMKATKLSKNEIQEYQK